MEGRSVPIALAVALFLATVALELAYLGTLDPSYLRAAIVANFGGLGACLLAAGALSRIPSPFALIGIASFFASALILYDEWPTASDVYLPLALGLIGLLAFVFALMTRASPPRLDRPAHAARSARSTAAS